MKAEHFTLCSSCVKLQEQGLHWDFNSYHP